MATLEVSQPIAYELLEQCIQQGQALVQRASLVGDFSDYESWKAARNQWVEPTVQALEHMHGGPDQAREFSEAVAPSSARQRWQQQYAGDLDAVKSAIELLTVMQGDLAFATGAPAGPVPAHELMIASGATADATTVPATQPALVSAVGVEVEVESEPEPEPEASATATATVATADPAPDPGSQPNPDRELEYQHELRVRDERREDPAAVGAALAPASLGAELAQHANGSVSAERAGSPGPSPAPGKQVLLAHGRNDRWMQAVAQLLERAGTHEVTVLNERPNERSTLADQLGERAPGSRYAIVLLTADDIGAPRVESEAEPYFSPRAHQAVVFEMGFLVAALAPGRVCVLYEEGVQLPCDLEDIAYVRLDLAGTWQPKLLLQLRKAGFDYDLNKLAAT